MIYKNTLIFKKSVRSNSKQKFDYKKTLVEVLFFVNFEFFS